jgi:hypothetical protein
MSLSIGVLVLVLHNEVEKKSLYWGIYQCPEDLKRVWTLDIHRSIKEHGSHPHLLHHWVEFV